jgi:t-SNARE complex subunit (syntaxin)
MTRRKKIEAARTEALFRSVNEHIAAAAEQSIVDEAHFVCECSDASCVAKIEAPLDEYEQIRTGPKLFLVKPGHSDDEVEQVVSDEGGYEIVEKDVLPPAY